MSKLIGVVLADSGRFYAIEVRNGTNSFEVLHFIDCPMPDRGMSPEWLQEIWNKHHFICKHLVCLIPSKWVKFKSQSFPNLTTEQLEASLRLEHETKNEIFKIIGMTRREEDLEVRTAVIDNDKLQNYLAPFESAGFRILWFGPRFQGIQAFLNFHQDYFGEKTSHLYLDICESLAELGWVNESGLLYRRQIHFNPNDPPNSTGKMDRDFLEELRLSLVAASQQNGDLPDRIWLLGDVCPETFPFDQIAEELKLEAYLPMKSRFTGTLTTNHTAQLAALLGLALDELDWAPQTHLRFQTKIQLRHSVTRGQLGMLIKAGVGVLFILGGLFLGIKAHTVREAHTKLWIEEHASELSRLKKLKIETKQALKEGRNLENWLDGRGIELEFLKVLQDNLPENTEISDLIIEDGRLKTLSGLTPSVSLLLQRFEKIPELKGLKLKGSITTAKDSREQFQMESTTKLKERIR